jgi:hypothetical protein
VPRFALPERFRRRRGKSAVSDGAAPPPPRLVRRAASPGALRRERRAILKAREEMLRDLGGLTMEMYRQEKFREDLLAEQARDIANLEVRLHELDSMLAAAAAGRRATASRCECGAPIIWGSHFCANCGRPVGEAPIVTCSGCGHPLPADAAFCPSCGKTASPPSDDEEPSGDAARGSNGGHDPEATVIRPAADGGKEAEQPDRWED